MQGKKSRFLFMALSYNVDILRIDGPRFGKGRRQKGWNTHDERLAASAWNAGILESITGQFWRPWPHCPHRAGHGGVFFSAAAADRHCGAECGGPRRPAGLSVQLGVAGYCVPPMYRQGLADAMEKMCASRARREEMGRIGQRRVDAYFHHEQMLANYRKMYDETAKEYHLE